VLSLWTKYRSLVACQRSLVACATEPGEVCGEEPPDLVIPGVVCTCFDGPSPGFIPVIDAAGVTVPVIAFVSDTCMSFDPANVRERAVGDVDAVIGNVYTSCQDCCDENNPVENPNLCCESACGEPGQCFPTWTPDPGSGPGCFDWVYRAQCTVTINATVEDVGGQRPDLLPKNPVLNISNSFEVSGGCFRLRGDLFESNRSLEYAWNSAVPLSGCFAGGAEITGSGFGSTHEVNLSVFSVNNDIFLTHFSLSLFDDEVTLGASPCLGSGTASWSKTRSSGGSTFLHSGSISWVVDKPIGACNPTAAPDFVPPAVQRIIAQQMNGGGGCGQNGGGCGQ
jgi:hypothetical protein